MISRAGVLACLGLTLASPHVARGAPAEGAPPTALEAAVIPPGNEELFAAMLGRGAALPDGCTFATGQIERTAVRGVYHCAGGEVVLELRHPGAAPASTAGTAKIAIVTVGGAPPVALVAALEQRIREREDTFEWLVPEAVQAAAAWMPRCRLPVPVPDVLEPYFAGCYPRIAAVLVGMAQTIVIVLGLGFGLLQLRRTARSPERE